MLHRRTLNDDALGVGEPLNEMIFDKQGLVVNGIVSLIFDTVDKSARLHRELAHRINNRPISFFMPSEISSANENIKLLSGWSAMGSASLPPNLHLLTFAMEYRSNEQSTDSILVRIEHFYEAGEDQELSKQVTINLIDVFNGTVNFIGAEELALGANMRVEELNNRLKWNSDYDLDNELTEKKVFKQEAAGIYDFVFVPMQIRTFRIFYLPK